ncbi:14372_t:CDS:10 [Ambispora leptoticha]|uniref:14372_t:CDS:1 n=1 Tax=Ambispora leptoticha TaxID=144679 RepID=A0A9N8VHM0_9GLOM|nr:14372_t:CDS:10 [Ambispora leptoticha]
MSNNSEPIKEAFAQLDALLEPKPAQNDIRRRGRPPKKENVTSKQIQKVLQDIVTRLKDELAKPKYIYNVTPDVIQHNVLSLESLLKKYNHLKIVTKKVMDIINFVIGIIVDSKIFEKQPEKNWEKLILNILGLIETTIIDMTIDRETMGKIFLKLFTEVLLKSTLNVEIRRMTSDLINTLLTGCKENKKFLSHGKMLDIYTLALSMKSAGDYELQFRHLEILFRLSPRIQEDREIFANKAFKGNFQLTDLFLGITADDFVQDTRNFLNALNYGNDGWSKAPKTIKVTRIQYSQLEFGRPDRQDCFFVDFNKWTISMTVQTSNMNVETEDEGYDIIDINYQKINSWETVFESYCQILKIYLTESIKIGESDEMLTEHTNNNGEFIISMTIASSEGNVKDSLTKIFSSHKVSYHVQPKVSVSVNVLHPPHASIDNAALALATLSSSLEASQTPMVQCPTRKLRKNENKLEPHAGTSQAAQRSNPESDSHASSSPRPLQESSLNFINNSPSRNDSLPFMNVESDAETHFPAKKRTKPLNLSASKKRQRIDDINSVNINNGKEFNRNTTINNPANKELQNNNSQNHDVELNRTKNIGNKAGKSDNRGNMQTRDILNFEVRDEAEDIIDIQPIRRTSKINDRLQIEQSRSTKKFENPIPVNFDEAQNQFHPTINNLPINNNERQQFARKYTTLTSSRVQAAVSNIDSYGNPPDYRQNNVGKDIRNNKATVKHTQKQPIGKEVTDEGSPIVNSNNNPFNLPIQFENDNSSISTIHEDEDNSGLNLSKSYYNWKKTNDDKQRQIRKQVSFLERLSAISTNENSDQTSNNVGDVSNKLMNYEEVQMDKYGNKYTNDDFQIGAEEKNEAESFTDDKLDQEIRSLLQRVGETIFRNYQRQDATLFQASQNALLQNETEVFHGVDRQIERKKEFLDTYKEHYASILSDSQETVEQLKESRNELANLDSTVLIDMEKPATLDVEEVENNT